MRIAQLPQRIALRDGIVQHGWWCDPCAGAQADDGWFVVTVVAA